MRRATERVESKFAGSWAGDLWGRLGVMDFMNQAIMLAATFLLCAVPFMIIVAALEGRSAVTTLGFRLGLSQQASADLGQLFAPASTTVASVTGTSWVFFIFGGIAAASTIQALYRHVFEVQPVKWDKLRALVWLALVVGWATLGTQVGHNFYHNATALWWTINIPAFVLFWWFTMWFLLARRVGWRRLVPCAVATGLFWIGMLVFFHIFFSGMVTSSYQEYGPIGAVFDLMSFFIAIGVVITLGAAAGMLWRDRAVARRLRRAS